MKDHEDVISQGFWHEVTGVIEEKPLLLEHGKDYTEGDLCDCECSRGEKLHFDFCNENVSARCKNCRTEYDGFVSTYTILIQPPDNKEK